MKSLHELVRVFPELGEVLAEFEIRISCLENSAPSVKREPVDQKEFEDRLAASGRQAMAAMEARNRLDGIEKRLNQKQEPSKYD